MGTPAARALSTSGVSAGMRARRRAAHSPLGLSLFISVLAALPPSPVLKTWWRVSGEAGSPPGTPGPAPGAPTTTTEVDARGTTQEGQARSPEPVAPAPAVSATLPALVVALLAASSLLAPVAGARSGQRPGTR